MRFELVRNEDGLVLDRIDATGETVLYETGAARDRVRSLAIIAGGEQAAIALLADGWSNGYSSIRRVD